MPKQPFLIVQKITSNYSEQENHLTKDLVHQLGLLSPNPSLQPQQGGGRWGKAAGLCPSWLWCPHPGLAPAEAPEQPSHLYHGKD